MKEEESGYVVYNKDETKAISFGRRGPMLTSDPVKVTIYETEKEAERDIWYYNEWHEREVTLHIKHQTRIIEIR